MSNKHTVFIPSHVVSKTLSSSLCPGVPGAPSNIRAQVAGETLALLWNETVSNGAEVTYTVTITLSGEEVYQGTSTDGSLSIERDMFQERDNAVVETDYVVVVEASNSAGTGGQTTASITVPSGGSND